MKDSRALPLDTRLEMRRELWVALWIATKRRVTSRTSLPLSQKSQAFTHCCSLFRHELLRDILVALSCSARGIPD